MKRLLAIITVIILTVVFCVGSFAGASLDRLYVNANVLESSTNLAGDSIISIDSGDKIYILGWAMKAGTNVDFIYYTLNGEVKECDGTNSYAARPDVAGVLGISTDYAQRSSIGANNAMMELLGIDALENGKYTVEIKARYQDETEDPIKSFTLQVGPVTEKSYNLVTGTGSPARWLTGDGQSAAVVFTTTIPFSSVSVPQTWASRQDQNRSATVVLNLYNFRYNAEYSMTLEPIATYTYDTIQDGLPACSLDLGENVPAGTYIFEVKTVGENMHGDNSCGYLVLDKPSATPDESLFRYIGTQPFSLSIFGSAIDGTPVTANPADAAIPYENVALGKAVVEELNGAATMRSGFWDPSMLTDGVAPVFDGVNACALGWYVATPTQECDIKAYIDLGGVYSIDKVSLVPMGFLNGVNFPSTYEVYTSVDGLEWTLVGGETGRTADAVTAPVDVTFDAVEANFVGVRILAHTGGAADAANIYSGFGEIEVYGEYVRDTKIAVPAFVPHDYVISRDQVLANNVDCALVGGNPAITVTDQLFDKAGQEVRLWGWAVSKRPIEGFGYSIDGGDIVYDDSFTYPAEQAVLDLGTNWGTGKYGESTRYNIIVPFETVCKEIRAYVKIDGKDILFWTVKAARCYKNYEGAARSDDPWNNSAWTGFQTGVLKYQAAFKTDVSFSAINFPAAWAKAGVPLKFTIWADGQQDGTALYSKTITLPGDGGFMVDFGEEIPAGQYVLKMKITDDTKVSDNEYYYYAALGYADVVLGNEYVLNSHGTVAFELVSSEEGEGFVQRDVIVRTNVDAVTAGDKSLDTTDGSENIIAMGTESMSFNGWMAANAEIEQFGYIVDGGDPVFDDSYKMNGADADAIMAVAANMFGFAANGTGYRCTINNIPLNGDGAHTVEIVAKIGEKTYHFAEYSVYTPSFRDFSKDAGDALSYDQILVNGTGIANGNDAVIAAKALIDGSDGSISTIAMHGWYGNANSETVAFGYKIDDADPVFGDFFVETESAVTDLGANNRRFTVTVDVSNLPKGKDCVIRVVAKLANNDIVTLNRFESGKDRDIYVNYRSEAAYGFSLDGLSIYNSYPDYTTANHNLDESFSIDKGDKLYVLGWVYKTYTNVNKIMFYIGEEAYECSDTYRARADVGAHFGINTEYFDKAGFGLDSEMMELIGIDELDTGVYQISLCAEFDDEDEYVMKAFTLIVNGDEGTAVVDPTTVEIAPGEDVVIDVSETEQPVEEVIIDSEIVGEIIANKVEDSKVEVKLTDSTVVLDSKSIDAIAQASDSADASLTLTVKEIPEGDLNAEQKEVLKEEEVVTVISVSAKIGNVEVHDLGGGVAEISVPFTIDDGYTADDIKVAYVDDDGNIEIIEAVYENGVLTFSTTHFSTFVVYYATSAVTPPTGDAGMFAAIVALCMAGALVAVLAIRRKESR